jgi:hypothetical protein
MFRRLSFACARRALTLGVVALLGLAPAANAGTVRFDVSDPQIDHNGDITLTINGKPYKVSVKTGMDAAAKANAIASQLGSPSVGFTVDYKTGSTTVKLPKMPDANTVTFDPGTTGESKDSLKIGGSVLLNAQGDIQFRNPAFDPFDYLHRPSVFTAGFSTDLGTLTASVDSLSLPDTSGTTIAGALFAALQPQAGTYGVSLGINGDTLSTQFDPAAIQSGGAGLVFGTSAQDSGVSATLATSVPEPATLVLVALGLGTISLAAGVHGWGRRTPAPAG